MPRYTDIDKLIAEYDRVHVGPPGGARKLMEDAPIADVVPREEAERWKNAMMGECMLSCCILRDEFMREAEIAVAKKIFKEILNIIRGYSHSALVAKNNYGATQAKYIGIDILKLKEKYTKGGEGE